MTRRSVSSGGPWEESAGYSRAVRVGNHVHVSGTTSMTPGGIVGAGDAEAQARQAFVTIEQALHDAGAGLHDVVRTRMFVTDRSCAEGVLRAHAETFHAIRPAATIVVVSGLLHPELLVEIEADAVID